VEAKPRKTGTKPTSDEATGSGNTLQGSSKNRQAEYDELNLGRFPANFIHDGSDEVVRLFPETKGAIAPVNKKDTPKTTNTENYKKHTTVGDNGISFKNDSGSASRFFKTCEFTNEEKICQKEKNDQNVKSAENQSDLCETSTVQEPVKIKNLDSNREELQATQDSTGNSKEYSQHQKLVNVENQENTDTIEITLNHLKSSGSALSATGENTSSDIKEKAEQRLELSRLIYTPKASKSERNKGLEGFEEKEVSHGLHSTSFIGDKEYKTNTIQKNNHPTVKPISLMKYLCRLITPKGGTILDPFMGSGSTGIGAKAEGFDFIGIELDADYCKIAQARIGDIEITN